MKKTKEEKVQDLISELMLALPGYDPLEVPKVTTGAAERFALATMYKDKAFRDYLVRSIRLNIERFQGVKDMYGLAVQQGRVLVLKELLALSQQMFHEAEKINKSFEKNIETEA